MSEMVTTAIITAGATLIGLIFGFITSYFKDIKNFERQKIMEERNHNWLVEAERRKHQNEIKERRCKQAEQLIDSFGEDFYSICTSCRDSLLFMIENSVYIREYELRKTERLPARFKPIIIYMGSKASELFDEMQNAYESASKIYIDVFLTIKDSKTFENEKTLEYLEKLQEEKLAFQIATSKLLQEIDNVRSKWN